VSKAKSKKSESVFFLKLVLYMIIGSLWLKVILPSGSQIPLPIGLIVGLLFASHEHFRIDRKLEYVVLLIAMFIGFWTPMGLQLTLP
jgi:uncharacterized transporter YbjL